MKKKRIWNYGEEKYIFPLLILDSQAGTLYVRLTKKQINKRKRNRSLLICTSCIHT